MEYKLMFYDFEVFKYDWMVVLIDYKTRKKFTIVNDREMLLKVYENAKKSNYIWVGYNSRTYDMVILKSILLGMNPYEVNNKIILQDMKEHQILGEAKLTYTLLNFDISNKLNSLKQLEGFMGSKIKESDIDFTIDRKLTQAELEETELYCTHDVEQTIEVFENKKEEFDSQASLIKAFDLPFEDFNRTKAQLVAKILQATQQEHNDEFNITFPDTVKLDKYQYVLDWFKDPKNHDTKKSLYTEIAGIPHTIGWGGIHGSKDNLTYIGTIMCADVASLYPAIMIEYGLLSRNVENPDLYRDIRNTRLELKKAKNPMQLPYKIVLNSTYGASGDKYNPLYDPRMCRCVCVYGQLLLLDLIEKIEPYCNLIQSNTDGVYLSFDDESNIPIVEEIMHEWEHRTRLDLEIEYATGIYQKDVNNYVLLEGDYAKSKGAYVKKLSKIDYDLPIINKALMNKFTKDIEIEDTINNCDDLIEFQKIVKVSKLYSHAIYGDVPIRERVLRVFASTDENDKGVFKVKGEDKIEKIGNTPERCFIYNENVIGVKVPPKLDRQYYIDMANKRMNDFLDDTKKSNKEKNEIKGVPNDLVREIMKINENKPYKTLYELFIGLSNLGSNQTQFEVLVKLGYLTNYGSMESILLAWNLYKTYSKVKNLSKKKCDTLKISYDLVKQCSEKATDKTFSNVDGTKLMGLLYKEKIKSVKPITIYDKISWQFQYTGYIDIVDESENPSTWLVMDLEVGKYNVFANLYQICSGVKMKYKIDKKWYNEFKCNVGEVLNCFFDVKRKGHWKMIDGQDKKNWVLDNEYETILKKYSIK